MEKTFNRQEILKALGFPNVNPHRVRIGFSATEWKRRKWLPTGGQLIIAPFYDVDLKALNETPRPAPEGAQPPGRRLTPAQKIICAHMNLNQGTPQHDLATIFGVNAGRVAEAVKAIREAAQ